MSEPVYRYMTEDEIGISSGIVYAKKHDRVILLDTVRDLHLVEHERSRERFFVWPKKLSDTAPTKEELKAGALALSNSIPLPNAKRKRK